MKTTGLIEWITLNAYNYKQHVGSDILQIINPETNERVAEVDTKAVGKLYFNSTDGELLDAVSAYAFTELERREEPKRYRYRMPPGFNQRKFLHRKKETGEFYFFSSPAEDNDFQCDFTENEIKSFPPYVFKVSDAMVVTEV